MFCSRNVVLFSLTSLFTLSVCPSVHLSVCMCVCVCNCHFLIDAYSLSYVVIGIYSPVKAAASQKETLRPFTISLLPAAGAATN
jgi:hypothetical protein